VSRLSDLLARGGGYNPPMTTVPSAAAASHRFEVGGLFTDLWTYRGYILTGAIRDLKQRYAGSGMGILWHVVTPMTQIVVYFVVFSRFLGAREGTYSPQAYAVFLCAGILPWFVFAECITRGTTALLANEGYLKKLAIPEAVFVAQTVTTSGLTLALYALALMLIALGTGIPVRAAWILIPVVLLLFLGLCFGLALILATVTVFFRDVTQIMSIVLQVWFWLTPVVYSETSLGPRLTEVMRWNPPTAYILAVRRLLIDGVLPAAADWMWMAGLAILFTALGASLLQRLSSELRDAL
jgi:lipopolysaccharide transport system permease protein